MIRTLLSAGIGSLALAAADSRPDAVRPQVDRLTKQDGLVGAVVSVRDKNGHETTWTSGTAQRGTGKPMVGADGRVRAASVTKPVIGVTVMNRDRAGKAATLYVTGTPQSDRHVFAAFDAALCSP